MIKEWLLGLDNKKSYSYRNYEEDFCLSCIFTGIGMMLLFYVVSGTLRYIGLTGWFLEHSIVRALMFVLIGTFTTILASIFGGKKISDASNLKILDFMFISIITSLTLLQTEAWWLFVVLSLGACWSLLCNDDLSEKWYLRLTAYSVLAAVIIYLILAIFFIGLTLDNAFDLFFGVYLTLMFPLTLRRVVLAGLYFCKENDSEELNKLIKKMPYYMGYGMAKTFFLQSFLNIGEIMLEVSSPSGKK